MSQDIEVPLSQGLVAIIDAADAPKVFAYCWHAWRQGKVYYAKHTIANADGTYTSVLMHAFLTGYALTDHRNGDGLDNRRANLREATKGQNNHNVGIRADNSSGFKGVCWDKNSRKWHAYIGFERRQRTLGRYATPEAAALAYDDAARRLHGEFARLNFPGPGERGAR